jgi:hypothetical protein
MNFTVIWRRVLMDDIARFYVNALEQGEDANAVTRAVATIDHFLAVAPATCGESRGEYERVFIITPLTVVYEIHEDERVVFVLQAFYAPGRPRPEDN